MSEQADLTLRLPGTFQRMSQESTSISGEVTLNVTHLVAMVRAAVSDGVAQQMLDLQRMQLARDAWDAMTPEQRQDGARDVFSRLVDRLLREMKWADALRFFTQIVPTEDLRRGASPEACDKIVRAAADRIATELKSGSWDGKYALEGALREHMASVIAEHARRNAVDVLDDGKNAESAA